RASPSRCFPQIHAGHLHHTRHLHHTKQRHRTKQRHHTGQHHRTKQRHRTGQHHLGSPRHGQRIPRRHTAHPDETPHPPLGRRPGPTRRRGTSHPRRTRRFPPPPPDHRGPRHCPGRPHHPAREPRPLGHRPLRRP